MDCDYVQDNRGSEEGRKEQQRPAPQITRLRCLETRPERCDDSDAEIDAACLAMT